MDSLYNAVSRPLPSQLSQEVVFKKKLIALLGESPESVLFNQTDFTSASLRTLFSSGINLIPQYEVLVNESYLVALKKTLSGIFLLGKRSEKPCLEKNDIKKIIRLERDKYRQNEPRYLLFDFLLLVVERADKPDIVMCADTVSDFVKFSIKTGYIPALLYAIRIFNGGLDGIKAASQSRRSLSQVKVLIVEISAALKQAQERIQYVLPERSLEFQGSEFAF